MVRQNILRDVGISSFSSESLEEIRTGARLHLETKSNSSSSSSSVERLSAEGCKEVPDTTVLLSCRLDSALEHAAGFDLKNEVKRVCREFVAACDNRNESIVPRAVNISGGVLPRDCR